MSRPTITVSATLSGVSHESELLLCQAAVRHKIGLQSDRVDPPSRKPALLYYSLWDGTDIKYGSLGDRKQASTVFTPKVLADITERLETGPVSMTRAVDGAGPLYMLSSHPAGLVGGEVQEMGGVNMKGEFPWTLEEHHRVTLSGLGVK